MRVLLIGDVEKSSLWENWSPCTDEMLAGVDVVVSVGDLRPDYLEFLVTMLNVPLLYVRGNHDTSYDDNPPEGCENIDDRIVVIRAGSSGSDPNREESDRAVRFIGLGGSMRYRKGKDMYTEEEMARRVRRLWFRLRMRDMIKRAISRRKRDADRNNSVESNGMRTATAGETVDVFVTHSPSFGYGDLEDLAHSGFKCFNDLLMKWKPGIHCFAHIHMEYGMIEREAEHPSGTRLINGSGMYIFEI